MILPFVREILAELEQSPAFERVRRHLSLATGRRRVSGLTATARALYIPLFARAAKEPVIVVVPDNKAAEALELALRAGCELTGAFDPKRVMFCLLRISRRIQIFKSSGQRCCGNSLPARLRS
jgi:transcription-repair coupling factor (superfamily II helicase)